MSAILLSKLDYTLDGRDFVSVISGYRSSSQEADALVLERLTT